MIIHFAKPLLPERHNVNVIVQVSLQLENLKSVTKLTYISPQILFLLSYIIVYTFILEPILGYSLLRSYVHSKQYI